jgi:hypothetical protein
MTKDNQTNLFKVLAISLIVALLSASISGIIVYSLQKKQIVKLNKEIQSLEQKNAKLEIDKEAAWEIGEQKLKDSKIKYANKKSFSLPAEEEIELNNLLENIKDSKEITPNQKNDGVNYYYQEFKYSSSPYIALNVSVFNYNKGDKMTVAYEGTEFERDLDKEVKALTSINENTQEIEVYSPNLIYEKIKGEIKNLGNKTYFIYDAPFKPAGTMIRNYLTFDEKTNYLIFIKISYATYGSEEGYTFEGDQVIYPQYMEEIFNNVEEKLN